MYKIKVGISACLLGQEVRFDGGHKRSSFCERDLGAHFEYHPVCPEMAIGLGAPRAAIRLVKRHGEVRAEASNGSFESMVPTTRGVPRRGLVSLPKP